MEVLLSPKRLPTAPGCLGSHTHADVPTQIQQGKEKRLLKDRCISRSKHEPCTQLHVVHHFHYNLFNLLVGGRSQGLPALQRRRARRLSTTARKHGDVCATEVKHQSILQNQNWEVYFIFNAQERWTKHSGYFVSDYLLEFSWDIISIQGLSVAHFLSDFPCISSNYTGTFLIAQSNDVKFGKLNYPRNPSFKLMSAKICKMISYAF